MLLQESSAEIREEYREKFFRNAPMAPANRAGDKKEVRLPSGALQRQLDLLDILRVPAYFLIVSIGVAARGL